MPPAAPSHTNIHRATSACQLVSGIPHFPNYVLD
jgi:hypothetical protein